MNDLFAVLHRTDHDTTITLRRSYRTTPADLWTALTDPDRLARWLAPVSGELTQGGSYRIAFDADDPDQQVAGSIEECQPGQRLRVTWQALGDPVTVVTATISEVPDGAELLLVHEGLEHVSDTGHAAGWQIQLLQLEAELAGEPVADLWDQWPALQQAYEAQVSETKLSGTSAPPARG